MTKKRVVVLGAGLAGLSSAYHLKDDPSVETLVLEKSGQLGGTARSIKVGGFTFDVTGHLLHLHFDYTKDLIQKLLKDNIASCVRNAAIYSCGKYTPYPFQANTYGLPKNVIRDCVEGFKKAVENFSAPETRPTSLSFKDWSLRTFGTGITKHFMRPYNEKLWQVKIEEMTAEWCGMFVPQPKLEDVVNGSKKRPEKAFGYNATFLYPKRGGIQALSEALGQDLPVKLNTAFEKLNWKDRTVTLAGGKVEKYDRLISTVPLLELLKRIDDLPTEIKATLPKLRSTSVFCVNLGVNRANISDKSWIYFPENKFVFYRVGFPMNFTPHTVPPGCSSMYVEIAHPSDQKLKMSTPALLARVRRDLESCGILKKSDKIVVTNLIPIKHGYVIYTPERKKLVETIFRFLHANGIDSIGRYGEWKYSFMEEAIMDGKKTAEKILTGS